MKLTVKQKAGLKLLTSSLRKKYPFINGFDVNPESFERYGTMITVDIRFDLEKFYKYYNVGPPKRYFDATAKTSRTTGTASATNATTSYDEPAV